MDAPTRLTVKHEYGAVDLAIASDAPLAQIIPELVALMQRRVTESAGNKAAGEWLNDHTATWHLSNAFFTAYDPSRTLAELDILDGSIVYLRKDIVAETMPVLVDDISSTIAASHSEIFSDWTPDHTARLLGLSLPLGALLFSVLAYGAFTHGHGAIVRVVGALVSVVLSTVAALSARLVQLHRPKLHAIVTGLELSAGIWLAAAFWLGLPASVGVLRVAASGVALLALVAAMHTTIEKQDRAKGLLVAVGMVAATIGALGFFVKQFTTGDLAAIALVAALNLILEAPRLSLFLARVHVPFIPAPGESFVFDATQSHTKISANMSAQAIESIIGQEERVLAARWTLLGLVIGAALVSVASCGVLGTVHPAHPKLVVLLIGLVCLAWLFRGKSDLAARIQKVELSAAGLGAGVFLAAGYVTNNITWAHFVLAGAVAVSICVGAGVCATNYRVRSPGVKRMFEIVEMLTFSGAFVTLALVLDLYAKARQ